MDDQPTEMVTSVTETGTQSTGQTSSSEMMQLTKAEYDAMQKALKQANREAAERRKALDAIEAERKAKEEAELSETERLKRKISEMETALKQRDIFDLRRRIAQEVGLPEALASRLQGETQADIEADAETLLEALPKPQPMKATMINPTNPGDNARQGETEAEQRARLYGGRGTNIFDATLARQHGGGVYFNEKQ